MSITMNTRKTEQEDLGVIWFIVLALMIVTCESTGTLLMLLGVFAVISYRIVKLESIIKEPNNSDNNAV